MKLLKRHHEHTACAHCLVVEMLKSNWHLVLFCVGSGTVSTISSSSMLTSLKVEINRKEAIPRVKLTV